MTFAAFASWLRGHEHLRELLIVLGTIAAAIAAMVVVRRFVLRAVERVIRKTSVKWDDALVEHGVLQKLSWLAPVLVVHWSAVVFQSSVEPLILRLLTGYSITIMLLVISSTLTAINDVYSSTPAGRDLPIKGYVQTVKLLVFLIGTIVVFAVVLDKSPWVFLSGVGAATAILLLVFRDTLLSFVASIQLALNDMVRIGDTVQMPKYDADGEVIDLALHTVKVRNWDLTVTTIPTFKLIEDSFKNWRLIEQAGARRIKRAIHLDQSSVSFLDDALLARLEKVQLLAPYLRERGAEIAQYNAEHGADTSMPVNGRRMTNLGTFRAYLVAYLRDRPKIRQDMTMMVRLMDPTPLGIPLEVYAFVAETSAPAFEQVQSDIFDHILASLPHFGLRVFQRPTGHDARIPSPPGASGGRIEA